MYHIMITFHLHFCRLLFFSYPPSNAYVSESHTIRSCTVSSKIHCLPAGLHDFISMRNGTIWNSVKDSVVSSSLLERDFMNSSFFCLLLPLSTLVSDHKGNLTWYRSAFLGGERSAINFNILFITSGNCAIVCCASRLSIEEWLWAASRPVTWLISEHTFPFVISILVSADFWGIDPVNGAPTFLDKIWCQNRRLVTIPSVSYTCHEV